MSYMSQGESLAAVQASQARALALCARAAGAVDQTRALRAVAYQVRAGAAACRGRGARDRDGDGSAWPSPSPFPLPSPSSSPSLLVVPRSGPPALTPGLRVAGRVSDRVSDRVVRRPARRRRTAASTSRPPDPPPDRTPDDTSSVPHAPAARWADATVYATRTLHEADAGGVGTGMPGDPAGRGTWTVREVDARALPGSKGARCLIFENHEVVRRVWDFPATWPTLPAAALFGLAGLRP